MINSLRIYYLPEVNTALAMNIASAIIKIIGY